MDSSEDAKGIKEDDKKVPVDAPQASEQAPKDDEPSENTQNKTDGALRAENEDNKPDKYITWTASEFIAHSKTPTWYIVLAAIAIVLAALAWYFNGKDWLTAIGILVGAVLVGVYAARKPRQLPYTLDSSGLTIGDKHYQYSDFRSFSVDSEGAFSSIVFMPLKRFALYTTIYYDPTDEDKIIEILHDSIPRVDHKPDPIEQLLKAVRF